MPSLQWPAGQRVVRIKTFESGTVVSSDVKIKVRWDSGRTSYYDPHIMSATIEWIDDRSAKDGPLIDGCLK